MVDAADLSLTDGSGASLWHPRTLADLGAIPVRVWALWHDMRAGMASRDEGSAWQRPRGIPTSHHYEPSPLGPVIAACGHDPYAGGPVEEWVRDPSPPLCRSCTAALTRAAAPASGWGTIGGVPVGAHEVT